MSETDLPTSVPRYATPQRPRAGALLVTQDVHRGRAALAAALGGAAQDIPCMHVATLLDGASLSAALATALSDASMGFRVYLHGDEAFVWPLHAVARAAGLGEDEIDVLRDESSRRLVYCVHCGACQASTAASFACEGCGITLDVRRHFSRRHGAYLGVCADADRPYGELLA